MYKFEEYLNSLDHNNFSLDSLNHLTRYLICPFRTEEYEKAKTELLSITESERQVIDELLSFGYASSGSISIRYNNRTFYLKSETMNSVLHKGSFRALFNFCFWSNFYQICTSYRNVTLDDNSYIKILNYRFYSIKFENRIILPQNSSYLFSPNSYSNKTLFDTFYNNLEKIKYFPSIIERYSNLDFSCVTDMSFMFYRYLSTFQDFENLINNIDTSNAVTMESMFNSCKIYCLIDDSKNLFKKLQLNFNNFDTTNVINMSRTFKSCEVLSYRNDSKKRTAMLCNLNLESWNTYNVTTMKAMFLGANYMLPMVGNFNTKNVTDMSKMFYEAYVANPDVRYWDTSKVVDMSYMFAETDYASPDVTMWKTSSLENISHMFYNALSAEPNIKFWDRTRIVKMENFLNKTRKLSFGQKIYKFFN